jgi:hypothetical protein
MAGDMNAIGLPVEELLSEPATATLTFRCKCGCSAFNCDVETYADFSWRPKLICLNCKQWCVPTEPMTNGPH